jgi:protein TonB
MPMPMRSSPPPSRVIAAVLIAAVHVGVGYVLMNLRTRAPIAELLPPVDVRFISEAPTPPHWEPPKVNPVQPRLDTPTPTLPVIDIPVAQEESAHAITVPVTTAPPPPPAPASATTVKLVASVEYLREPVPRYPAQSRKLREQGLVVLRVLIDERGTACDVAIENSSGHQRLDQAARDAIARAEFRPYIEDGVARRAMVLIPIEFSLNARVAANGAANGA